MTPIRWKAVLFDLDDTLVDHQHSYRSGLMALREHYPVLRGPSFQMLEARYIDLLERLHTQMLAGAFSIDEARVRRTQQLFAFCGQAVSREEAAEAAARYQAAYHAAQRPVPGVRMALMALREMGIKIGVVTNHQVKPQEQKLRDCGLDDLVDTLTVSEAVGVSKPAQRIFEVALADLGCSADEVMMVGDKWGADIMGAHGAGMRALWLNRYGHAYPDPAIAVEFHSFEPTVAFLDLLRADS